MIPATERTSGLLSVREAAGELQVSVVTLYRYMHLPSPKGLASIRLRGRRRIRRVDLERFIKLNGKSDYWPDNGSRRGRAAAGAG